MKGQVMVDDSSWPASRVRDDVPSVYPHERRYVWLPDDVLDLPELPPLVYPLPLVDKALLDVDD